MDSAEVSQSLICTRAHRVSLHRTHCIHLLEGTGETEGLSRHPSLASLGIRTPHLASAFNLEHAHINGMRPHSLMDPMELKETILGWGASLVGFGDLEAVASETWRSLKTGVSVAMQLSNPIVDHLAVGPTFTYAHHYRSINHTLDSIAIRTVNLIQALGYQALPVPASQVVDHGALKGVISHKMVATRAGLGWIGKSALLITPQYGPRIRLVSVLTDAPLRTSRPTSNSKCGECLLCVKVCPAAALKGRTWASGMKREELMDAHLCHAETSRNKEIFGEKICGMCISVCPVGRKARESTSPQR
jgi:epoxyqueuosine reductase